MSPRPIRPTSTPTQPNTGYVWALIGAAGVAGTVITILWAAGHAATKAATGTWAQTKWSPDIVLGLPDGVGAVWPKASPVFFWFDVVILTVPLVVAAAWGFGKWSARTDSDAAHRSLAKDRDVQDLLLPQVRQRAKRLRPSLADTAARKIKPADAGIALGHLDTGAGGSGPVVYADFEQVGLCLMSPRTGKTTAIAIPTILSAPGAVLATSNKADLLITASLRAKRTGQPIHIFDPQGLAHTQQGWWWDPIATISTVEAAERLSGHFINTMAGEKQKIWGQSATELLGGLILAAAFDPAGSLSLVYSWLVTERTGPPAKLVAAAGFGEVAASLQSIANLAPETKASVYFTARAATACLRNPQILAWVTPPTGPLPRLDPADFVTSTQTLYLLSKDSGGSAAPLVAALADAVIRAGIAAAEAAGGRLDPPLTVVLDEAASVAPIQDLPLLASHAGSRGIFLCTILQSWPQGAAVWQEQGMSALWGAATIKLIGPGQEDPKFNELLSKLLGDQWVTTSSISTGGHKGNSTSTSVTRAKVMDAAAIRSLPKGHALLFATGAKGALIRLLPWYDTDDRQALELADKALAANIAQGASRARP